MKYHPSGFLSAAFFILAVLTVPAHVSAAAAQGATDPCPAPAAALQAPSDMARIQADIDRFNLCIERAKLLKQLNDLTLENEQASMGISPVNPGMILGDDQKIPASAVQPQSSRHNASTSPPRSATPQEPEPVSGDPWYIVEIFGQTGDLQAKLSKKGGSVERIRAGSTLSDGQKVEKITSTGVVLGNGKKGTEIGWLE